MRMANDQKLDFIKNELAYELRCLLGSEVVWRALRREDAGYGVIVAMDWVLVHSRCLFKFFTQSHSTVDIALNDLVGMGPYTSPLFTTWEEPINRHVQHISGGRLNPHNIQGEDQLSELMSDFKNEIVTLWEKAEIDLGANDFGKAMEAARTEALKNIVDDANKFDSLRFVEPRASIS